MKLLLTTIAAVVLVGCGASVDIHKAAYFGNIETVKQAIADGADVNAKDDEGLTPLHHAAFNGPKEIVELLITEGADLNAKSYGETPLDLAIRLGQPEIADLLRKHGGKHSTIHAAARGGSIEEVKQHLAAGTDVNAKDTNFMTPLHIAANNGHKEVAELLIAEGADVNAKGVIGITPLHYALTKEIAELLITKGADVNAKNRGGSSVLDYATRLGQPETADLLRKHGGKTSEELKVEGK